MGLTCCHLRIKLLTGEELLLTDAQGKWFLEVESTPREDAVKTVAMTTKDLEYYRNLVDKAEAGFERITSDFARSSAVGKMLSNSTACYREFFRQRKSQSMRQTLLLSYFKKWPPAFSNHHSDQSAAITLRQDPPQQKDYD